jgi:hypothetical protein
MEKLARPEIFLPLKPHWFHVLLSLADREQHGYGIMQEVLDRTGGKVRLWPGTTASDPVLLLGAPLLLASLALVACYVPARKSMRIEPVIALRQE